MLLLLQQPTQTVSPPGGDTVGYWQQRADYRVVARLDEAAQVLHGTATLTYVNHSPDTLHEMRVQQLLNAFRPGSRVHDEIVPASGRPTAVGVARPTNNAGGLEGGMTNGKPVVVRGAMKPISTLGKPLKSVDLNTKETAEAGWERSDISAISAASVVMENVNLRCSPGFTVMPPTSTGTLIRLKRTPQW